jgi:hypothetical protein
MLSENIQTNRDKYCMLPFIYEVARVVKFIVRKNGGCQARDGGGGDRQWC